jgi:hypothetical protein
MEIAKTVNELVNTEMKELLENTTNKIGLVHKLNTLMVKRNILTEEIIVLKAYVIKNTDRLSEIKNEIKSDVLNETDNNNKPKFSNEAKRSIETDLRLAKNPETIYLNKQIETNKDQIIMKDLIINNLRKLIEITLSLLKTL